MSTAKIYYNSHNMTYTVVVPEVQYSFTAEFAKNEGVEHVAIHMGSIVKGMVKEGFKATNEWKNYYNTSYNGGDVWKEVDVPPGITKQIGERFPSLKEKVSYPCKHNTIAYEITLSSMIQHLNDVCRWSREQIADWLETLDLDITLKENK